ncbi:MAG TPA: hypothetical protein VFP33_06960 [Gallionella sp.]|nr:hypothetical protein [Gallionella sp.]
MSASKDIAKAMMLGAAEVNKLRKHREKLLGALQSLRSIGVLEPGLIGSGGGIEEAQEVARKAIAEVESEL